MLRTRYDCHARIDYFDLARPYIAASNLEREWYKRRRIPNPETVAQHQMDAALLVMDFSREIEKLWVNIHIIQDTLLIHDLAEPDPRVQDRTPHDRYDRWEHRRNEEMVIREILSHRPELIEFWLDMEDGRTQEWRLWMEFDKLQAILKARKYEDRQGKVWLTQEFFTHSVVQAKQITTAFLVQKAMEAMKW